VRREYPDAPIVGVGAVVLDGKHVLLVRRGREPLKGEWSLPGGALELGETLEAGISREVEEETGIQVKPVAVVEVLDRIVVEDRAADEAEEPNNRSEDDKRRVRFHYVLIDFLCTPTGGSLSAGTDAEDARWVAREELNSHSVYRVAPATVAVIEKGFGMFRTLAGSAGVRTN
jgi:8-oxo-dGTP diphosphatase